MKGPKVITAKPFNNPDSERCYYFSEEAVRGFLREEYKQANNLIRLASSGLAAPVNGDIIEVEKSIESAISKLKAKFNEIEPVPLTKEILEKIADDISGDTYTFYAENGDYVEVALIKGEWWQTVNSMEYKLWPLPYVHNLQKALRLCGIEKEVEL